MSVPAADGNDLLLSSITPMRCRKTGSPPSQPVTRKMATTSAERMIPNGATIAEGAPKSHPEARAQNRSLVPQKNRVRDERAREEADRENHEHGMDWVAENGRRT